MTADKDKGSGMLRFFVDRRCIKILQILSERQDYISIGQLADLLEQTRRQTQYDIYKINMIFDTVGLPPVETKKKKGVCLLEAHKTWWREFNGAKENSYNYIFTQEEPDDVTESWSYIGNQYTVQRGDTLAGISMKIYQSYDYIDALAEANQIANLDEIYPGQVLNIPPMED